MNEFADCQEELEAERAERRKAEQRIVEMEEQRIEQARETGGVSIEGITVAERLR